MCALQLANSNSIHYLDVRHHFLRELVTDEEIVLIVVMSTHVLSEYRHAGFLTKTLLISIILSSSTIGAHTYYVRTWYCMLLGITGIYIYNIAMNIIDWVDFS